MRSLVLAARVSCTVVIVVLVWQGLALDELAALLRGAPWWLLPAPWLLLLLNAGIHAVRAWLLLPKPRPALVAVYRAVLTGNFFGLVLPTGGGEAMKAVALGSLAGLGPAVGALVASRLLELVPWGLLLGWGALVVLPAHAPSLVVPTGLAGVAMLSVAAGALLVLLGRAPAMRPSASAWPRRLAGLAARIERLAQVAPAPRAVAASLGAACVFALVNCLTSWVILHGCGAELPLGDVMGLIPALDVVISLPVTVSGVGVREGMYAHGLAGWGFPAEVAVAAAMVRFLAEAARAMVGGAWWAASPGVGPDTAASRDGRDPVD